MPKTAPTEEIAPTRSHAAMPTVAIVGRPNVGKSSLLNALVGKRISIVQDMPGVTRDRINMPLEIDGRWLELVDTGGYGFVDPDQLTEHIKHQIELAMASANLVLFLVDCQAGLTGGDQEIASLLRGKGIKTILVANKADGPNADVALGEFARLGLGTPVGVSALRERNLDLVIDAIRQNLDLSHAPRQVPEPSMMLAIVGKRNAGKSTLVNSIAANYGQLGDRVIVSEIPGTTRDSIDVRFEKDGQTLIVIDTAGVRKKKRIATNDIEFYSFHRAQRSVRRADVVLLLIDGVEPVSEPDKKLAQYISDQFKPCMLVVNKWDMVRATAAEQGVSNKQKRAMAKAAAESDEASEAETLLHAAPRHVDDGELMEEYRKYLDLELGHLDYAPIAFVTAKDGRNVQGVLDEAQRLFKQSTTRLSTGQLNRVVRQILAEKLPSTSSGRKARIYYATQTSVAPPTIVLFVNQPLFLDEPYRRFMVNRFRELLPFAEVPIQLLVRGRDHKAPTVALDEQTEEGLEEIDPQAKTVRKSAPGRTKSGGIIRSARKPASKKPFRKGSGDPKRKQPPKRAR